MAWRDVFSLFSPPHACGQAGEGEGLSRCARPSMIEDSVYLVPGYSQPASQHVRLVQFKVPGSNNLLLSISIYLQIMIMIMIMISLSPHAAWWGCIKTTSASLARVCLIRIAHHHHHSLDQRCVCIQLLYTLPQTH